MLPGCCRSSRPAAGQQPPGPRQQPPQQPLGGRAAAPLEGRAAAASGKRLLASAERMLPSFHMPMCFYLLQTSRLTLQHRRAGFRPSHDAGLSPCARNTIREAISRDTSSSQHVGHAVRRNRTRSAAGTFSGHRQCSRRICHQKCGCRESLRRRAARRGARAIARRGGAARRRRDSRQPHFWWQIVRLHWR